MDLEENAYTLLNQILDHSYDEIFITDPMGDIVYTRPSTEKLFGVPHEKMIGQNVFDLEKEGVFSPSVIVNVLKNKKERNHYSRNKKPKKADYLRDIQFLMKPIH